MNKAEAALWQPPQDRTTQLVNVPVPPLPPLNYTSGQLSQINGTITTGTYTDPVTGEVVTMTQGDMPNPDAAAGQFDGPTSTITAPQNGPPLDGNQFNNLIATLTTVLREAGGGSWVATATSRNHQIMCQDLGLTWGQPYGPRPAGGWCAVFVSWALYKSGLPVLVSGRSQRSVTSAIGWSTYGQGIDPRNPRAWRKGDIIITKSSSSSGETRSGNHVTFLWTNPGNGSDTAACLGGNQGRTGDVTAGGRCRGFLTNSKAGGVVVRDSSGYGDYAYAVRRGWNLPPSYDVPLFI